MLQQAGLRQRTRAGMSHRMARGGRRRELRNDVQRIRRRAPLARRVSIDDQPLLAGAGAMAAQAGFILIDCRNQWRHAIECADAVAPACDGRIAGGARKLQPGFEACALWQSTQVAWRLLLSSARLGGVVEIVTRGQRMAHLRHLGHDIGRGRRNIVFRRHDKSCSSA